MKKMNTLLAAALSATSMSTTSLAQDQTLDARVGTQVTTQGDQLEIRSTLGIAPEGAYNWRTANSGQFKEIFRAYDVFRHSDGGSSHFTALGFKGLELNLGFPSEHTIYGVVGDQEGVGLESVFTLFEKTDFTFNIEHNATNNSTRIGGEIERKLTDALEVGVGYDVMSSSEGTLRQLFFDAHLTIDEENFAGFSFAGREEMDNTTTNRFAGYFLHKGEDFGARVLVDYVNNSDRNFQSYGGAVILAQNPTTGQPAALFWTDRKPGQDGLNNPGDIYLSVTDIEGVRLNDRVSDEGGLALEVYGRHTTLNDNSVSKIGSAVGYTLPDDFFEGTLGMYIGGEHTFGDMINSQTNIRAGGSYRLNSNLEIGVDIIIPVDSDHDTKPRLVIGGQINF